MDSLLKNKKVLAMNLRGLCLKHKGKTIRFIPGSSRLSLQGSLAVRTIVKKDCSDLKQAQGALRRRIEAESLIGAISREFMRITHDDIDSAIEAWIRRIGLFLDSERGLVMLLEGDSLVCTHQWCREGAVSQVAMPSETVTWLWEKLGRLGEVVCRVADFPVGSGKFKDFPESQSILAVPMADCGIIKGFLGMESGHPTKIWAEEQLLLLRVAAAVFHSAVKCKRSEERLKFLSCHDALTGLYNRTYFDQELLLMRGSRSFPVTIVSTDLDGLKLINDTMGRARGNEIIKAYSRLLRTVFQSSDVVARVDGDEFAAILPHTDDAAAEDICQKLEEAIANYNLRHQNLPLSVSIGWATDCGDGTDLQEVLAQANKTMYWNKMQQTNSAAHGFVAALLTALAAKDFVSEGHVSRVGEMACRLGEVSGLSKSKILELKLLAEVHDLGKLGIPDRILMKEGPMTESEREEIKQHSIIGFRIAQSSPNLFPIARLILHHHEWWNGEGYPARMKGEDIPLLCRILAIADAYDAMSNDRPYRKALSRDEALRELRKGAGVQFDPFLVQRFIELVCSEDGNCDI